jgi:hypothetical protein
MIQEVNGVSKSGANKVHGKIELICPNSLLPKHSAANSEREFVYWQSIGF